MSVNETPSTPIAILALDVELRGENIVDHGMLAIGFCLGRVDQFEVIESGRIAMSPMQSQAYSKRTMKEFWCLHADVMETLENEAISAEAAIFAFYAKLRHFESIYDIRIVSDNTGVDIGSIDYYLSTFNYPPLKYKTLSRSGVLAYRTGATHIPLEYRPTYDTDGYARGALGYSYDQPWVSDKAVAAALGIELTNEPTHFPDDDARCIYEMHVKTVLAVNARAQRALTV